MPIDVSKIFVAAKIDFDNSDLRGYQQSKFYQNHNLEGGLKKSAK